ncbi:MAG TPA: complex I NDUFA9 subunit family protein [Usitatibacter sp.]|jgi:NADH dehydrogenase|nr:complex I NDUFA9 subunit family protein [Usitatibacter sp.]
MDIESVCILGGSGFVGRAVTDQLSGQGLRVRVVTRSRPRAMPLAVLPTVELVVADAHDTVSLARCFEGMDAVVNLVGILHERRSQTFQACHVELPRKVVEACHSAGVRQLLHMSALGASESGPSRYQRSKGAGEAELRRTADGLAYTILRPSVVFGEGDDFLNKFALLARWFPVIPLAGARTRFQPIWVEDVARCFAGALGNPRAFGNAYEICGPKQYTLEELVRYVAGLGGRNPRVVPLSGALASLQAAVLEVLPGPPMTRDNLASMSVDNICSQPFPAIFGFDPAPLEVIAPVYLAGGGLARARYPRFRHTAGR